ncbi:MAG: hypothetical protein B6U87_01835 [Candidatus Aenigmarchaeota archaeon ex4484_52]|nr:MAG: hypothetical protein B6U87_01835 [Candidatus Aenigmarchaeota archaeon ex4484_52]
MKKDYKKIRKLNGGGNFTDYTFERLERDKKENPNMLISGFVDGKLIYILEFPFDYPEFNKHLEQQLNNHFKDGKDKTGQFLRSANFHYKYFINCKKLKIDFLLNKEHLKNCKQYIVENFYKFLEENANDKN